MDSECLLFWNVRGLNWHAQHDVVTDYVSQEKIWRLCLQETKLAVIDDSIVAGLLGPSFTYFYLPVDGTRGGILLVWHTDRWCCSNVHFLPMLSRSRSSTALGKILGGSVRSMGHRATRRK
jgi:hypothetical protein